MSQKYFTTLTNIGAALHANAQLQQTTVPWTHLVLGDGNGVEPVPSPAQTGVIREVDRLAISSIETDPNNPNWIVIEAVIPADRGGYVVRETALMGTAGGNQCIAVGNYPSATKPLLSEGAGSELVIRMVVEIAHTATVTLKIDPAVVIASRDWVEKQHATQQKRGLVRLATLDEAKLGQAGDIAVTPEGAMEVASGITSDSGMVVLKAVGVINWPVPEVLRSGKKMPHIRGAGGGGSGAWTNNAYASGGSGGGYFEVSGVSLVGVTSVTVTVGAGGAAPASVGMVCAPGGATSFGTYASATGGGGGSLNIDSGPLGGVATSSILNAFLADGGRGGAGAASAESLFVIGGAGGGNPLGNVGASLKANSFTGGYGVGSGGRTTPVSAGSNSVPGSGGVVIIQW